MTTDPFVFVFFHEHDRAWGDRILWKLEELQEARPHHSFGVGYVVAGSDTQQALRTAAANATLALVLVSDSLLADEFCQATLIPLLVASSVANDTELIFQAIDQVVLPLHLDSLRFVEGFRPALSDRGDYRAVIAALVRNLERRLVARQPGSPVSDDNVVLLWQRKRRPPPAGGGRVIRLVTPTRPTVVPPPTPPPRRRTMRVIALAGGLSVLFLAAAFRPTAPSTAGVLAASVATARPAASPTAELPSRSPPALPPPRAPVRPGVPLAAVAIPPEPLGALPARTSARGRRSVGSSSPAAEVQIHVRSDPADAAIYRHGTLAGSTSHPLLLPRSSLPLVLSLEKRGYQTLDVEVTPDGDRWLRVELVPIQVHTGKEVCPEGTQADVEHLCDRGHDRDLANCTLADGSTDGDCVALATRTLERCCRKRQ